eukprot:NODE_270_length_12222_cov_0.321868.p6 type:complete len:109 gc:universal NODE_270_length_12222_cov_0.321868:5447-5121(-)
MFKCLSSVDLFIPLVIQLTPTSRFNNAFSGFITTHLIRYVIEGCTLLEFINVYAFIISVAVLQSIILLLETSTTESNLFKCRLKHRVQFELLIVLIPIVSCWMSCINT